MDAYQGINLLYELARLYHVQIAYYDMAHHRQNAAPESLLTVLRALGACVETIKDAASAWRQRRKQLWEQVLEPVNVVWESQAPVIEVHLASNVADSTLAIHLTLETGEQRVYQCQASNLQPTKYEEVDGRSYVIKAVTLPEILPLGYHRLTLEILSVSAETLVIVAPVRAYNSQDKPARWVWGCFCPLYAISTRASWGSGDFSSLQALIGELSELGGRVVATLPLLANFLDEPFDPSPYAPVSRLFWNEFYLDLYKIPELQKSQSAQALLASPAFQEEINALRRSTRVDYRQGMAIKRLVLEELCQSLFSEPSDRLVALQRYIEATPQLEEYARFRATLEKKRIRWQDWPEPLRRGTLNDGDYDEKDRHYHLYVQWLAQEQIEACSRKARSEHVQLYFDLPTGVHPDGYDVWHERDAFASNISVGAPPDPVFTSGQNWHFPPLHPEEIRKQGYKYMVAYLRNHLRYAGILRIDHVMSLHRLYWIPTGLPSSEGIYVRYRAEEQYAILALESLRHNSIIVGEDLGTVPPEVRPTMTRHGLHRMFVLHYELQANYKRPLRSITNNFVASLNTHDMPHFAAFWKGLDISQRLKLGLLDRVSAEKELEARQATKANLLNFLTEKGWIKELMTDTYAILKACLAYLGASQAGIVLVNLEDLWLETEQQNMPGSIDYPNWQRKSRYTVESICKIDKAIAILRLIEQLRKRSSVPRKTK